MNLPLQAQLEQIAPQVVTKVNHALFNPVDFVENHLEEPHLRFSLASNIVWSIDSSIVSAATGLYFDVRRENPDVANNLSDLINTFRGTYDNESYWGDGNAKRIVQLLRLQYEVHNFAYRCASTIGRDSFAPRAIHELVTRQTAADIGGQEATNIHATAKFLAEQQKDDEGMTAEEIEQRMKTNIVQRNEEMANMRRGLLPAVLAFVDMGRKFAMNGTNMIADAAGVLHPADASILDLSTQQQLFIVRNCKKACDRAPSDWVKLDTLSHGMVLVEAHSASKTFNRVIDKLVRDLEVERAEASY